MRYGSVCSGIESATQKECAACHQVKQLAAFHRQPSSKDGRHTYCADCYNVRYRGKKRPPVAPEVRRWHNVKQRYGLTPTQVEAMRQRQDGKCAVCSVLLAAFHIDHDHDTGRVRGLLCHRCNVGIAILEKASLRAAALAYLGGE